MLHLLTPSSPTRPSSERWRQRRTKPRLAARWAARRAERYARRGYAGPAPRTNRGIGLPARPLAPQAQGPGGRPSPSCSWTVLLMVDGGRHQLGTGQFRQSAQRDGDPVGPVPRFVADFVGGFLDRSEEHTSELQSLMRRSYAVFCLKKK